jgi:3',5'-cyclic-AMP phosphodiesterase
MKRFAWATDIHLDFVEKREFDKFVSGIKDTKADALFVTGDIANGKDVKTLLPKLQESIGMPIYYVLGNHDFYGSSISSVRTWAADMTDGTANLRWLPECGVVVLDDDVAMIGVDGWGDGRLGNWQKSTILLNDWDMIEEFKKINALHNREARLKKLRAIGMSEAMMLKDVLLQALKRDYKQIVVLTHVPPWKAATWHEGEHSDDDWLPWFSCAEVGQTLIKETAQFPHAKVTVLCGHTHGGGHSRINNQINVYTGEAHYYMPEVQGFFDIENGTLSSLRRIEK